MFESNEILDRLPRHLMKLVIDQPYNEYTPQDHAVWRYVMRRNVKYLSGVAHESYVDGLRKTGVSIDEIPHMYGMNRILKEIGWAAVTVDGFIPPAAFMEFQAYKVLVIAADIRPIEQINYTPAPDIIHEAAGHAPIIANDEYAEYLRRFGEIGHKAFSSYKDYQLYEAIRHLSILKADPYTKEEEIKTAEQKLSVLENNLGEPSEMARIRNLHWWTVEYGLIGDLKKPKIYGAGLLSSIGESYSCLKDDVQKLPYTIEAADVGFDITTKQPQLFVTPDFKQLTCVLEDFANGMGLRRGGLYGIKKAIDSEHTATLEWGSGIQVSGTFTDVLIIDDQAAYVKSSGPSNLNFRSKQLPGHDKSYHAHGFSSPIGKVLNHSKPLEMFSESDLEETKMLPGENIALEYASGITVKGILKGYETMEGKLILLSLENCTVRYEDKVLFEPSWGTYDMAIGEEITSAFPGPADPDAFEFSFPVPEEKTHKIHHSEKARKLHDLYMTIRNIREGNDSIDKVTVIFSSLRLNFPDDWLLPLEILELINKKEEFSALKEEIKKHLEEISSGDNEKEILIKSGMELFGS